MASDRPLVFRYTAPSLKNITAARIAIRLWKSKIVDGSFRQILHRSPSQFVFDNSLPVPQTLVRLIDRYIGVVEKQLELWACFYGCRVFNSQRKVLDIFKAHFDEIAWHPDGCVNEVLTARAMLEWPSLSILNKLKIAYAYCFVEDIRTLRPLLPSYVNLSAVTFEEDPLTFYWEHWYRDRVESTVTADPLLGGVRMIGHPRVDRWSAVEWLFGRMSSFERRRCATIIALDDNSYYLKKMLGVLDGEELDRLVFIHGYEMMTCLMRCYESRLETRQVWAYVKHKFDDYTFHRVIRWMWRAEAGFNSPMPVELVSMFLDIWTDSPDRLKRHVFRRTFADASMYNYRASRLYRLPRNLTFFTAMLSDIDFPARNVIWRTHWRALVRGTHPIYIKELLKLCMVEEEIEQFEENTMGDLELVKEYCRDLLKQTCYNEMNMYLRFCLKNEAKIFRFKERLIKWFFSVEVDYPIDRVCTVIDRVFRNVDVFRVHECGVGLQSIEQDEQVDDDSGDANDRDVEQSDNVEGSDSDRSAFVKFFESAVGKFKRRFLKNKLMNCDVCRER